MVDGVPSKSKSKLFIAINKVNNTELINL